jgi:rhomboid protease GluP
MAAVSKSFGEAVPQESPVTYFILAANFMLFTVCLAATGQITGQFSLFGGIDSNVLTRLGARSTGLIFQGEVWRLVMPIFLHGGLLHIGMNMFALKSLGPELEEVYGSARYLFLYVVTGVIGFAWTTAWNYWTLARMLPPDHPLFGRYLTMFPISIGASGSLMGLLGLAIAITTIRGGSYMQAIRKQLLINFGVIVMLGLMVPGIDNAAHIGGFVSGFVFGRLFEPREPLNPNERTQANMLGWIGGLIVVGSFAATVIHFFMMQP